MAKTRSKEEQMSLIEYMLRILRIALGIFCVIKWVLVALGHENDPMNIGVLIVVSVYIAIHLSMNYTETYRVRRCTGRSTSFKDFILDVTVAVMLWVSGTPLMHVRTRAERIIRRDERRQRVLELAREMGCENEVATLFRPVDLMAAEKLLQKRQAEALAHNARLATVRGVIERNGWQKLAKPLDTNGDVGGLEGLVAELTRITNTASELNVGERVQELLVDGAIDTARKVIEVERIATNRRRVIQDFGSRIRLLDNHPESERLARQHAELVAGIPETTDRDFRKRVHALERALLPIESALSQRRG